MAELTDRLHIVAPKRGHTHTHTIIFLHGRDSTATEFSAELFESQASDRTLAEIFPSVKWIFPTAKPLRCERFGVEMSQWFDMWSTENPEEREDLTIPGLNESVSFLLQLIRKEVDILGEASRVVLGGISQGCATAIHALFHFTNGQLGGFVGLCSWLPSRNLIARIISESENPQIALQGIRKLFEPVVTTSNDADIQADSLKAPVFLSHSLGDPVINVKYGEMLSKTLRDLGMAVEWKSYDNAEHWITEPKGVDDLVAFLDTILR